MIVGRTRTSDLIVKVNFKFNNLDSLSFPLGSEPTMQSTFLKLGKLLTAATKPTRERSKLQRSLFLKLCICTLNFFDTEQRYCPFSSGVTFLYISKNLFMPNILVENIPPFLIAQRPVGGAHYSVVRAKCHCTWDEKELLTVNM